MTKDKDKGHIDLNGRLPQIGDVIYRLSTANWYGEPEIITGFTPSGNPKLSRPSKITSGGGYILYANGYITSGKFVILDTPDVDDLTLECFNKERKNRGLMPLKKYGNT